MSLVSHHFPPGFVHYPEFFNYEEQKELIAQIKLAVTEALFFSLLFLAQATPFQ